MEIDRKKNETQKLFYLLVRKKKMYRQDRRVDGGGKYIYIGWESKKKVERKQESSLILDWDRLKQVHYEYKWVSNMASTVTAAWDNHFSAFGGQDLEKILLDYTDESEVIVWDTKTGTRSDFKGLAGVKDLFTGLFAKLSDLSTLAAPLIEVQESSGMVFLVWECPGCGYQKVTDTFIFKGDKILRQNIVVFSA